MSVQQPHKPMMRFTYVNGIPTVEQAMRQALGWFVQPSHPIAAPFCDEMVRAAAEEALAEIRSIQSGEMSTLFDIEGEAIEWNEAVEMCLRAVEGTL